MCEAWAESAFKKGRERDARTGSCPSYLPVTGRYGLWNGSSPYRRGENLTMVAEQASPVTLSEIAAGLEVTTEQEARGVAAVDDTDTSLPERLREFDDRLPCTPAAAATLVTEYAAGASVGAAAREAGVAPVTGAKALHRLGEPVQPLGPTGRELVRDWLDARLPRTEAVELAGGDPTDFALAVYVETHDPIPGAREAVSGALSVETGDPLAETHSDTDEFL
jgi:hypothetical protein